MLFQVTLIKVNDNIKVTLSLVFNTNKQIAILNNR